MILRKCTANLLEKKSRGAGGGCTHEIALSVVLPELIVPTNAGAALILMRECKRGAPKMNQNLNGKSKKINERN